VEFLPVNPEDIITRERAFPKGKPLWQRLIRTFGALVDFVYPPTCLVCGIRWEGTEKICLSCWEQLLSFLELRFQRTKEDFQHLKGKLFFDGVITCWAYALEIERLIFWMKYQRGKKVGLFLGNTLGHILLPYSDTWKESVLVPVPLHSVRVRERGYNQSELLARGLAAQIPIRIGTNILIRRRQTATQTNLNADHRQENVKDAFCIRDQKAVCGKDVILVDDVVTTGATMNSCARSLKEAGAERIIGVALARPELR